MMTMNTFDAAAITYPRKKIESNTLWVPSTLFFRTFDYLILSNNNNEPLAGLPNKRS